MPSMDKCSLMAFVRCENKCKNKIVEEFNTFTNVQYKHGCKSVYLML